MNYLGHEPRFWVAVLGATVLKLATSRHDGSPRQMIFRAVATVAFAVFAAWVFTDPIIARMGWDPDTYKAPTAALLALSGEGFMRSLMKLNLERAVQLWKDVRR